MCPSARAWCVLPLDHLCLLDVCMGFALSDPNIAYMLLYSHALSYASTASETSCCCCTKAVTCTRVCPLSHLLFFPVLPVMSRPTHTHRGPGAVVDDCGGGGWGSDGSGGRGAGCKGGTLRTRGCCGCYCRIHVQTRCVRGHCVVGVHGMPGRIIRTLGSCHVGVCVGGVSA